ncbi:MAG TPA: hypothetical protein VNW71_14285 [Thermoanaerobaculia bacterium]|nr:hypothetical protein [Thermoanaerobaculia bacterium]
MVRFMIPRSALLAFALFAGFLLAGEASAQCDVNNPLMTCPLAECIMLQGQVHAPDSCGPPAPLACRNVVGCFNRQQMKARWLRCYETRNRINVRCFSGGDMGHQIQAAQAIQNATECTPLIAEPPPLGCGPC